MIEKKFQIVVFACLVLTLIGCSRKSSTHIEGPYYLDLTKYASLLVEPGGIELDLTYKKNGKTIVISKYPGGDNNFSWRVYGSNLVFSEHDDRGSVHSVVFSEKNKKNIMIEDDCHYWKIIAEDGGITCHRPQDGQFRDDPHPKFFPAEYLKSF